VIDLRKTITRPFIQSFVVLRKLFGCRYPVGMTLRRLRVLLRCPAIFQTDWYIAEGEVTNLSLWGCAIETPRCLIPGEYVRLHMLLPEQNLRIEVGKVRWVEPYRFGVEFLNVPNDQHLQITRTVKASLMHDLQAGSSPVTGASAPEAEPFRNDS
jgi:hypothetical protein